MRDWSDLRIPTKVAKMIPQYVGDKSRDHESDVLWARFFDPHSGSEWFVLEFDGKDRCFGLLKVVNCAIQFGDFSLNDLSNYINNIGSGVWYDPAFKPRTAMQVLEEINSRCS